MLRLQSGLSFECGNVKKKIPNVFYKYVSVVRETNGGCLFGENNLNQIQQIDDGNKSQSADGYGVQPCSVSDDGKLDYQSRRNAAAGNNQPVVFDIYEQKCADSCRNQNIWALQHAVKTVEKVSERRNMERQKPPAAGR